MSKQNCKFTNSKRKSTAKILNVSNRPKNNLAKNKK